MSQKQLPDNECFNTLITCLPPISLTILTIFSMTLFPPLLPPLIVMTRNQQQLNGRETQPIG